MSNLRTISFGLALLVAAPAFAWFAPVLEDFKSSDYDSLGKLLATYTKARQDNKGVDKAHEEIAKEIDRIQKRIKRDPLASSADIGKALWTSYGYDRTQASVKKGKVDPHEFSAGQGDKVKLPSAIWTPMKYNPKQAYPLILIIPDKGEKLTDHLTEKWTDASLRENAILATVTMPEKEEAWLAVGANQEESGARNVVLLFWEIAATYAIDFDRVYLCGYGKGVEAAITIGSRYPDRFAGVIGRSGDAGEVQAENLRDLPTLFESAGAKASALSDKIDKLGYKNCTLKPDGKEADIWTWMQEHPRMSNPAEVVLYPGTQVPLKAYWLEVAPTDAQGMYVKGTIDRATNTITVEGEGVTKLTLFFNDVLVDLDKPVKVVCNGTETTGTVPRSLQRLLDFAYARRSDPGKLYVAYRQYDLPPKPMKKAEKPAAK